MKDEPSETLGTVFGAAETVANSDEGYETNQDWYLDEIEIVPTRIWWKPWTWFRSGRATSFTATLKKP